MKKVVKFGGSSLASAEQFQKVADIIHSDKERRYVVPSAPGKRFDGDNKVTDMLYACYHLAETGKDFRKELSEIEERYQEIVDGLGLSVSLREEFETIERNFNEKIGENYAASRGEYLNSILMAAYLGFPFVDAAEVIRFTEKGEFDSELTNQILGERLAGMENAVIPGFYGAYEDGRIKTFSRGGSDITGSIVARAVKAEVYENWTDVSGFLIADPRIIEDPEGIDTITYRELRELSYMGAGVFHEEAIFPVRREGIPINIRNTNAPADPGTMILSRTDRMPMDTIITGVAGRKGFSSITIEKDRMNTEVGFGRKVLGVLEDFHISFEHAPTGIDTMSVVVHTEALRDCKEALIGRIFHDANADSVTIDDNIALIAIVGRGMVRAKGTAGRVLTAIAEQDVNIRMIDQGSGENNIIVGVSEDDYDTALRAIYHAFVREA